MGKDGIMSARPGNPRRCGAGLHGRFRPWPESERRSRQPAAWRRPMNPKTPAPHETLSAADVRSKHKEFLFPATSNYYEESLVLTEGKGMRLRDIDGREYLDFFGGILTVSVGHCNDEVNAAVKAQIDRLGHVSTLYPTVPIVELAEKLASITPGTLRKC